MKKLLKSEVCESREQCTEPTSIAKKLLKNQILQLKKKKKGNADTRCANAQFKRCLSFTIKFKHIITLNLIV